MSFLSLISLLFLVNAPECLGSRLNDDDVNRSITGIEDGSGSGSGSPDLTPECVNAQLAVAANQPCFKAVMSISENFRAVARLPVNDDLQEYCSPSCKKLYLQLADACTKEDKDDDLPALLPAATSLDLICTVRGRQSCYQYLTQLSLQSASFQCITVRPNKCSSSCARALQKVVNRAGCCARHLLEFTRRFGLLRVSVDRLYSVCRVKEYQRQSACKVLNEETGCPYEGQIRQKCAPDPTCLASCNTLNGVSPAHPCIQRCSVNGCVCPNGTVLNEANKKCVTPNKCGACPIKGQIRKYIAQDPHCPSTCKSANRLTQGPCYKQNVHYGCECPYGEVVDEDKNECISSKDCGKPCKITQINVNVSGRRMVKITFSSNEPTARFRCKLDYGAMKPCKSPWIWNVRDIGRGRHRLSILGRCAGSNGESKMKTFRFSVR